MKENQNIEFKEKWKDEYLKVIAANTNGGKLLIGINERQIKAVIFVKEKGRITNPPLIRQKSDMIKKTNK